MDLASLSKIQILADEKRGFPVKFASDRDKYAQIISDLVGLFGEIGEFSNIVKKIGIKLNRPEYNGPSLEEGRDLLREELVDTLIYVIRLAAILDTDLEAELIRKLEINEARYECLVRD